MRKKMKSVVAATLITCMGAVSLAGCGDSSTKETSAPDTTKENETEKETEKEPEKEPEKKEGQEITLMASQNWIKDVDNELFKKFEEETGIKVKVSLSPDNEYTTLLGTTLAGGSDAVDMFMYSAGSQMISDGITDVAVDLSGESWVGGLEDWAVTANSYKDKLYGFSTWGIDYEGVLYNKTFFEENNLTVPETWDDFMKLCDQIKDLGVTPLYEGINGTWHTQSWAYALTPMLYAEKPDFVEYLNETKDNKFADLENFKKGLAQIGELLSAKDGETPKYYTNDGQAEDWFGSYTSLQDRETVMMFTYSAYVAELEANGAKDEFGMFPCPLLDNKSVVSNGGGISKFINKNSKNVDACKELLNFLAKKESLETYYGARNDLVTASFKDVESVHATTATTEALERTAEQPKTMFIKDVLYWDPDVYKYLQGMADGSMTPEEFAGKVDEYRATMFDTAA